MHVLVVYAHFNRDSFTHAVLEQVIRGLDDSPHTYTVNDLYTSGFDPIFTTEDAVQFVHEGLPEELSRRSILESWSSARRAGRCADTWRSDGCAARMTARSPERSPSVCPRT